VVPLQDLVKEDAVHKSAKADTKQESGQHGRTRSDLHRVFRTRAPQMPTLDS
jgi:hypothetical protein